MAREHEHDRLHLVEIKTTGINFDFANGPPAPEQIACCDKGRKTPADAPRTLAGGTRA
jgi:hypothetical protein